MTQGWVELRVHGVSGTPATDLLGVDDDKELVRPAPAGDELVRFERRAEPQAGVEHVVEGMTWGRLTSGVVTAALWVLVLPLGLANLAYWARPWEDRDLTGPDGTTTYRGAPRATYWHRVFVRAIALGLTALVVFTAAAIGMDMVGWQCWSQSTTCEPSQSWIGFGASLEGGRAVALGALLPILVLALLWGLSVRASLRFESFAAFAPPEEQHDDPHLFSRRMWQGEVLIARLRSLHLAAGLSVLAVICVRADDQIGATRADPWQYVLALAPLVLVVWLLLWPNWLTWREDVPKGAGRFLGHPGLLYGLPAAALGVSLWQLSVTDSGGPDESLVFLPGLILVGHGVVVFLLLALLGLGVVHLWARLALGPNRGLPAVTIPPRPPFRKAEAEGEARTDSQAPGSTQPEAASPERLAPALQPVTGDEPADEGTPLRMAAGGFAAPVIAAGAVMLGAAISAAAVFRVADLTGSWPIPAYTVAAVGTGVYTAVLLPAILVKLAVTYVRCHAVIQRQVVAEYADEVPALTDSYGSDTFHELRADDYRISRVVGPRVIASLVSFNLLVDIFLAGALVGFGTGVYAAVDAYRVIEGGPLTTHWLSGVPWLQWTHGVLPALRWIGTWAVTGMAFVIVALAVAAWRSEKVRRLTGVAWDILSFWPRAAHPLAPPCYCERAVPQLAARLLHLGTRSDVTDGRVVLAAHSQGTVVGVAALAHLEAQGREGTDFRVPTNPTKGVGLLTFGSPLMRFYAKVFPRIFWPTRLQQLQVHRDQRWLNLWRITDPLGDRLAPVVPPDVTLGPGNRDVELRDPVTLVMRRETSAYEKVNGHIDYPADPAYAQAMTLLVERLTTPPTAQDLPPEEAITGLPQPAEPPASAGTAPGAPESVPDGAGSAP